ncbi:MAG: hypothetical protein Q8927_14030 [Bacteroidota bacterium]|nr:hypothetical protein [Bacteroidota bacterium]MDP4217316.1 hypothetical protein [Bacteroidota bacterium]MDP4253918.1 hypothetical protein [Bacteroidota bacterium]
MVTNYFEEQKFKQKWVLFLQFIVLILVLAVSLILIFGERINPVIGAAPFLFVVLIVIALRSSKLQTRISKDSISYRFLPFQVAFREIRKEDIQYLAVKTYDPIGDYGGWGIRIGGKGRAYSTGGNKGLQIGLRSGKNLLLGTGRPAELEAFLRESGYL